MASKLRLKAIAFFAGTVSFAASIVLSAALQGDLFFGVIIGMFPAYLSLYYLVSGFREALELDGNFIWLSLGNFVSGAVICGIALILFIITGLSQRGFL